MEVAQAQHIYEFEGFSTPPFYFIINDNGVPIYEYPTSTYEDDGKTVLFSGMLSAVNSIAREISGGNINNMSLGNFFITISKAFTSNKLFIFIFSTEYFKDIEEAISIHMEFVSFLQIHQVTVLFENGKVDKDKLNMLMERFYRLKLKQLRSRLKK